ncbi:LAETG motif-containing sortase-dependent surface protein [Streptomyces nigrescens]|uniref:Cys-Gln thioester bond-forming surface protein n=1 Tax=Streptomyces nigrescens TaxID=1920 RepID=A0ABY7JA60_STRNI|nr:LAETG motif-containing sortase-dependent surface protein [Streptomyces nigrescens]WAU06937.1 Cys-Gln thioester bond-forming surface protein [Streptomyces nigrescens]
MLSIKRRGAARLAAAVVASGLVAAGAIATAGPAAADETTPSHGGATATLGGLKTFDQAVVHNDGGDQRVGAGLFEMAVDNGGTLQTYCIDIHNPTQQQAKYQEVPWSASSLHNNGDAGKIRWILQNSYPQVNDLAALAAKAGAGNLTEKTAAAGTQVAIWRFSDHAKVDAVDPAAEKLADYLEKSAQNVAEPKASLTLDPPAVSGKSGSKLGPVTVHTNADSVTISPAAGVPAGAKVVGKDGKPVTSATDGTQLFFDVPAGAADGSSSLTAQAATKVPVGRAFTGIGEHAKSQTQILAGSSESTVSAAATFSWKKQGAIPAITAEKNCAKGGVDVTASNKGDEAFRFQLSGKDYEIAPGKSQTVTVPVAEDQPYDITIKGEGGFKKSFSGVLDCKTAGSGGGKPSSQPSPASVGGSTGGDTGGGKGGDLAETGSSNATPMIAGIAVVLVVVGGAAVFFLRKKKAGTPAQ